MSLSWDDRGRSPYDVLGVRRDVGPTELQRVYRRLAQRYHPDRSGPSADSERMAEINQAYSVLTDTAQRQALDAWLDRQTLNQGRVWESEEEPSDFELDLDQVVRDVSCEDCGALDASIRLATWPAVASFVLISARPSFGGVQCAQCRNQSALRAVALTSTLGWWSPQGIVHSFRALWRALSDAPIEPAEENARILRWVGLALTARGQLDEARKALKTSLGLLRRRETSELLRRLGPAVTVPQSPMTARQRALRWTLAFSGLALVTGGAVFAGVALSSSAPDSRSVGPAAEATQPAASGQAEAPPAVTASGAPVVERRYEGQAVRYAQDDVLAVEFDSAFQAAQETVDSLDRQIDEAALAHRTGQADLSALRGRISTGESVLETEAGALQIAQDALLERVKDMMREQERARQQVRAAWLNLQSRHTEEE